MTSPFSPAYMVEYAGSRAGARPVRGFEYQHKVGALYAVRHLIRDGEGVLVPEGLDDITVEDLSPAIYAQVKSRADPDGSFERSEFRDYLRTAWENQVAREDERPGAQVHLVLERAVKGLGLEVGSFTLDAAEIDDRLDALLRDALNEIDVDIQNAYTRTTVSIEPDPIDSAIALLASEPGALDLPDVSAMEAHLIADRVATVASLNHDPDKEPSSVTRTDLRARLDRFRGMIDPTVVQEPLRSGVCEALRLTTPVPNAAFYEGVAVVPGHLAAGIVVERPEATDRAVALLETTCQRSSTTERAHPAPGWPRSGVGSTRSSPTRHTARSHGGLAERMRRSPPASSPPQWLPSRRAHSPTASD